MSLQKSPSRASLAGRLGTSPKGTGNHGRVLAREGQNGLGSGGLPCTERWEKRGGKASQELLQMPPERREGLD